MEYWLKRILAAAVVSLLIAGVGGVDLSDALIGPAAAQEKGAVPGKSLGTSSDSDLWRTLRKGFRSDVPYADKQKGVAIQSEGENWRNVRNGPLSVYGGWMLGGVIALLAVFFLLRGRIRVEKGMSGRTVERFNGVERFAHWLTATSFIVLGLTGLNILYGRYVILPVIGPEAFSTLTLAGKYAHNFVSFAFMIGIVMITVLWIRQNIPGRHDLIWLAKGGGMFTKGTHVSAKKFNAGQKIIFWLVIFIGISISFSGLVLMFPFTIEAFGPTFALVNIFGFSLPTDLTPMQEMQLTQLWHALLGLLMIALIFAHVYIGTLGMVGAFDAMGSGQVDENWAREHHDLWLAELEPGAKSAGPGEAGDD
ncbi:MAG: formate dehydrogenase subunit gamma [Proteobacteria bacterium]|nr:formate dehydrogenase subunit gamma [Pseudomonadota bacterium]